MKIIKKNYKFILFLVVMVLLFNISFNYYIDAPGGIKNVASKIELEGYSSKGSFNLVYIKEYKATIPTLIMSIFNDDWHVLKKEEVLQENENYNSYLLRDKILMEESISNAINVAYTHAHKDINVLTNKLYISYIYNEANTSLQVGDEILEIESISVDNKNDITDIISKKNIGDKIKILVKNNDKKIEKYAYVIELDNKKIIGVSISNIKEYNTNPKIKFNIKENESGPSGGLITSLAIYDLLIEEDITHSLKIVGTGTVDEYGNVGSIGGVEYKLKSAEKSNADLFIVPNGENLEAAINLKTKENYKIKILGVDTFDDVINYLNNL